jgi:hypothetical protein
MGIPAVVLPFVNSALASRTPFQRSVDALRAEGVRILWGPGAIQPHPPRTGAGLIDSYPWHLALDEAERMLTPPAQKPPFSDCRGSASSLPASGSPGITAGGTRSCSNGAAALR